MQLTCLGSYLSFLVFVQIFSSTQYLHLLASCSGMKAKPQQRKTGKINGELKHFFINIFFFFFLETDRLCESGDRLCESGEKHCR